MFALARKASRKKNWSYILIALCFYSIIFGLRYEVGMDYPSYLNSYQNQGQSYEIGVYDFEPGFSLFIKVLTSINAHFVFFFGLVAFLQIYLVFKTLKPNYEIYPYLVFTFMFGCIWLDFGNGLRQVLALCIYIYSLTFLNKKKWLIYCLSCILLATTIHKSVILLIPIYFILRNKKIWFANIRLQFVLFTIAYIIGEIGIVQQFIKQFEIVFSYMQYEDYLERTDLEHMLDKEISRGLGFYGILVADILLLSFSNKIKNYFVKDNLIKYFYNFFFVGILIRYAFLSSMMIQRVNYYFYYFKFLVAAYALYYAKKKNHYLFYSLIFLYLLYFIGILSSMEVNTSMYKFFWQVL